MGNAADYAPNLNSRAGRHEWNHKPDTFEPEPAVLDQKRVNDWYTIVLRKIVGTDDSDHLKAYAEDKKIRIKALEGRSGQMLTIYDRKNRILGQLPIKYFIKKQHHESN